MHKKSLSSLTLGLTVLFSSFPLISSQSQTAGVKIEAAAPAPIYTAAETADFIKLAKAALAALAAGNHAEMVAKLTDLETVWDDKEASLKPRDEKTWIRLDKTLDKAISSLRSSHVNLEKGKAALDELIQALRQETKS